MKLLFVCLGNICRSPTAEGVMRKLVEDQGRAEEFEIDSAGTGAWHVGNTADPRAIEAAAARGIELTSRARQVSAGDLEDFDLVVAMDSDNYDDLARLSGVAAESGRIRLLREFADGEGLGVPDPYHGADDNFEEVLDIIERNCRALLAETISPGSEASEPGP